MTRERLSGWGRTTSSVADVVIPQSEADIATHLATAAHVLARGLGRSYGDAAQLGGGLVLSNRGLTGVTAIDATTGEVTVGAGVSIDELLNVAMPQGWFVPVTPGTRQVTIGGALAADVHGKNHHVDGSLSRHVTSLRLVTPVGTKVLSPTSGSDLFWATMGGMGLTGIISEVTLRLMRIETDQMLVDTDRHKDLDSVMSAMLEGDHRYRYSVAWVDCMNRGRSLGRAVLTRGDHARASDVELATLLPPGAAKVAVPFNAPNGLLNALSVAAFNELWYRKAPAHRVGEAHSIASFFHPLDGVRGWNRFYGTRGFVQYQFAVPDNQSAAITAAIEMLANSRVPSLIGVLKRFGAANAAPLSFPIAGWTLAVDLPVGPEKLPALLDQLDEHVLASGGRIYFAKDARTTPERVAAMYPRLEEFRRIQESIDPEGVLTSDLARRLQLTRK